MKDKHVKSLVAIRNVVAGISLTGLLHGAATFTATTMTTMQPEICAAAPGCASCAGSGSAPPPDLEPPADDLDTDGDTDTDDLDTDDDDTEAIMNNYSEELLDELGQYGDDPWEFILDNDLLNDDLLAQIMDRLVDDYGNAREWADKYEEWADTERSQADQWRELANSAREEADRCRQRAADAEDADTRDFWEQQAQSCDQDAAHRDANANRLDGCAEQDDQRAAAEGQRADGLAQEANDHMQHAAEQRDAAAAQNDVSAEAADASGASAASGGTGTSTSGGTSGSSTANTGSGTSGGGSTGSSSGSGGGGSTSSPHRGDRHRDTSGGSAGEIIIIAVGSQDPSPMGTIAGGAQALAETVCVVGEQRAAAAQNAGANAPHQNADDRRRTREILENSDHGHYGHEQVQNVQESWFFNFLSALAGN